MVVVGAENCLALVTVGLGVVEVELGLPSDLDPTLNFEGSACKPRWVTQLD